MTVRVANRRKWKRSEVFIIALSVVGLVFGLFYQAPLIPGFSSQNTCVGIGGWPCSYTGPFTGDYYAGYATLGCTPINPNSPCAVPAIAMLSSFLVINNASYVIDWANQSFQRTNGVADGSTISVSGRLAPIFYNKTAGSTFLVYHSNVRGLWNPQPELQIQNATLTIQSISSGTPTASNATMISGSTAQSTAISGVSITTSGYLYKVVESPQCVPQCGMTSFLLTYLYISPGTGCTTSMGCYPPPRYYRLLNFDSSQFWTTAPNGTYAVSVSGILVTPSSWSCNSVYVPMICMIGDIYIQNLTYATSTQSITSTSLATTNETGSQLSPIPGFELSSILTGLILGLAILAVTKHRLHHGHENAS